LLKLERLLPGLIKKFDLANKKPLTNNYIYQARHTGLVPQGQASRFQYPVDKPAEQAAH
jgi:hypothetical protein